MIRGVVRSFSPRNGYGFVRAPSVDGDVFCHWSNIETSDSYKVLEPGQEVAFELERGPKGLLARKVTPLQTARQSA